MSSKQPHPVDIEEAHPMDIEKELMKLRQKDKAAFVRLIVGMVSQLASPEFKHIAASCSSWPVNVPVLRIRPRREKKMKIPFQERTREEWCNYVVDDLVNAGRGLPRNLNPAQTPRYWNPMTSLAIEIANLMGGLRSHPDQTSKLDIYIGIDRYNQILPKVKDWIVKLKNLPPFANETTRQWVDIGFELAQLKHGYTLEQDSSIQEWLEGFSKSNSVSAHTKNPAAKAGFLKDKFSKAFKKILKQPAT